MIRIKTMCMLTTHEDSDTYIFMLNKTLLSVVARFDRIININGEERKCSSGNFIFNILFDSEDPIRKIKLIFYEDLEGLWGAKNQELAPFLKGNGIKLNSFLDIMEAYIHDKICDTSSDLHKEAKFKFELVLESMENNINISKTDKDEAKYQYYQFTKCINK